MTPECDPASLVLSPAEGFLLSRIDGQTSWKVLREIGGMSPEEVDMCLESWLSSGILLAETPPRPPPTSAPPAPPRAATTQERAPRSADESLVDEGLELDVAVQRRILEFEVLLGGGYPEILGVAADASTKDVKRAYFKLSKEFHPDRYFRRNIGPFADVLERIFKKITEAHELLSDPVARAEIEKSMSATAPGAAPTDAATAPDAAQRPLSPVERLRQRMPFRIPRRILAEREQKAEQFFKAAQQSATFGRFGEAASHIRLAIAFNPHKPDYKKRFAEVQAQAAEAKAMALLESTGEKSQSEDQQKRALELFEETLLYRPHDPELNNRAARLCLGLHRLAEAREYLDRALEHSPEVARYHTTLALIHRAEGDFGHALHELEKANELDPGDDEARRKLEEFGSQRRRPMLGGKR